MLYYDMTSGLFYMEMDHSECIRVGLCVHIMYSFIVTHISANGI